MWKYIGTKMVEAEPAWRITDPRGKAYIERKKNSVCEAGSKIEDGYCVRYSDGYESWSPKNVFETAYLPLTVNQELRTDAPSISQQMVDDFIVGAETITMGDKCTVVRAILRNGFEIVESSACVSAENYDEKLGAKICMEKIKDKVWFLLGFLLQTAVHGVNGEKAGEKEKTVKELCGISCPNAIGEPGTPGDMELKAMLSQPMAGKSDEEIVAAREKAIEVLQGKGYQIVNTLFTDEWYSKEQMESRGVVQIPLCFLAKSLENMSLCHAAYFCKGWENARGCRIEHEAAKAYGLEILYEEEPEGHMETAE